MSDANNLKEKYPDVITLEALRQILHVSKRRCAWMLANGIIPCSNTGKKTRQYRIRIDDVIEYLERTDNKVPVAPEIFRLWLETLWFNIPDVLKREDIERITGYGKTAVSKWLNSEKLRSVRVYGEPTISKEWIIDFMCDYGWRIVSKSEKHCKIMDLYKSII